MGNMTPKVATFHAHNVVTLDELINAYIQSIDKQYGHLDYTVTAQLQVLDRGGRLEFIALVVFQ